MAHLGQPSCRSASLVTMWLLVACSADGAEEVSLLDAGARGPAVLVFYGDTTAVQLATSTRVGQVTPVRFTSFAGGCIRQDTTEAEVAGLEAEVRPYKREPTRLPRNRACTAELRLDQNVAQVRFVEPGERGSGLWGSPARATTRLCSSEIWRSCLNWGEGACRRSLSR